MFSLSLSLSLLSRLLMATTSIQSHGLPASPVTASLGVRGGEGGVTDCANIGLSLSYVYCVTVLLRCVAGCGEDS